MNANPYDRLKADSALQEWWQAVLDDPEQKLARILDAARVVLEQTVPNEVPKSSSITEVLAFQHVAREGTKMAFKSLELLGSTEMTKQRVAEAQGKQRATMDAPKNLGTGPARRARAEREK